MIDTDQNTPNPESRSWIGLIQDSPRAFIAYFALHAALGVMMRTVPGVSMLHAALTLVAGAAYCLIRKRAINWMYLAGYVVAAEVLWKMTRGLLFWEQGKYFTILILILACIQTRRAANMAAVAQFALLIPSAALTCLLLPLSLAKDALSFNLSGPLLLCVAAVFLATMEVSPRQLHGLFLVMLGPLSAIAVVTVYNIANVPIEFQFQNRSNYFVTGGFGPNQVSAALGLGILLGFFIILAAKLPFLCRIGVAATVLLMISQAAFTFSRNGLYSGLGASLLTVPFLVSNPRVRARMLVSIPLIAIIFVFVIFPRIDEFTGGSLSDRLEQTSGSGRENILSAELQLWKDNPIFGVGPGIGRYVRNDGLEAAAHTEFSRLLAEHGLFGFAALLFYPILFFSAYSSAGSSVHRALVVSAMGWAVSFMIVNALRMAAPGFMFGMAFARMSRPGGSGRSRGSAGTSHAGRAARATADSRRSS